MTTVNYAEGRKALGYWLRVEYGRGPSGGIYLHSINWVEHLEERAEACGKGFPRGRLNLYAGDYGDEVVYCCNLGAGERSEFLLLMGVKDERFL